MIVDTDRKQEILLGDEAVALGAIHAGVTASYAYPGTPSTEIVEYLIKYKNIHGGPHAAWCTNEKTAFEDALGVSFAGRRSLVAMKHVGLNVAADPFINSAIVSIHGGVVAAVADDPGMHSSQNEQDTRYLADFARVLCLEPSSQQEAYEMTREAFDLSEKFRIPVVVRLVTRLAHSRAVVYTGEQREQNKMSKVPDRKSWILLPVNARRQWHELLEQYESMKEYSEGCAYNVLELNEEHRKFGVITTGMARNYLAENIDELEHPPSHLHIGVYPMPEDKIRRIANHVDKLLVLEEGFPYVERLLRGIIPPAVKIIGKVSGEVAMEGELDPDNVRVSLGLEPRPTLNLEEFALPIRPPQLCAGCPHGDSFASIHQAVADYDEPMVTADIGCYTLGALPPYNAIETCVCMGASIGIAKGAAEAGYPNVIAVIGDSTFLHSGVTSLMDAVAADTDMTVMILDNEAVAMTGAQKTMLQSSRLEDICMGIGVDPDHFHVLDAHPKKAVANAAVIKGEVEHKGLSVVVSRRACLEMTKIVKKARKETK